MAPEALPLPQSLLESAKDVRPQPWSLSGTASHGEQPAIRSPTRGVYSRPPTPVHERSSGSLRRMYQPVADVPQQRCPRRPRRIDRVSSLRCGETGSARLRASLATLTSGDESSGCILGARARPTHDRGGNRHRPAPPKSAQKRTKHGRSRLICRIRKSDWIRYTALVRASTWPGAWSF